MKPIKEVLKIKDEHVIIDCCPTKKITDYKESPVSEDDLKREDIKGCWASGMPVAYPEEITRDGHIFYLNIRITNFLLRNKEYIKLKCPTCISEYKLTKKYVEEVYRIMLEDKHGISL